MEAYKATFKIEKRTKLHRSISMRCDDVLENLRKATPCFITGKSGQESNAGNSERPECESLRAYG